MNALLFMLLLTIHNTEEALWLVEWRQKVLPNSNKTPQKSHFIFAVIGITILGYMISGFHILYPRNKIIELCFIGFVGAMLFNAFIPHLALSIRFRRYCPGTLTGCLLMIPFNGIIIYNTIASHLNISDVAIATLLVGIILLIAIPIFQAIAKKFLTFLEE